MLITLVGPDGTGKTTLATKVAEHFENITYLYFGSNVDNRNYKYFEKFIKKNRPGKFLTALKYLFIFMNDVHYLRLAKEIHVISDRCPIDKYVATKIHNKKYRHFYHKLILKFLPEPDLIILLEGDLETIYLRKKEISIDVISKMITYYREYINKHDLNFRVIDTTKNDIDESYQILESYIKEAL